MLLIEWKLQNPTGWVFLSDEKTCWKLFRYARNTYAREKQVKT